MWFSYMFCYIEQPSVDKNEHNDHYISDKLADFQV